MTKQTHVACFGAHPDDCEIYASGALLALRAAGAQITIVVATDGALSHGPPSNPELAGKRAMEAKAAASILGAQLEMLGFPDGYLSLASEAMVAVNSTLERLNPDLVLTHHPSDMHRDHRELSRLVTARIHPTQKMLYIEPLYGVVQPPNLLVDISAHWEKKTAAVCEHQTQDPQNIIMPVLKTWNEFRALQFGMADVKHAEGYIVPPLYPWVDPVPLLAAAARVRNL
jgi:N-acetylglucosamine malate deacetylase 1